MNTKNYLDIANGILLDLMNEECFDFWEVHSLNNEKRKEYLRQMIFCYFENGEVNLGGVIKRVDSNNRTDEGASKETVENINNFFKNEELVDDVILLMDQDIFDDFNGISNNYEWVD